MRGGLALVAAVLGGMSVTHSLARVIENDDPAQAHQLAPNDGRIAALLASVQLAENTTVAQAGTERLARRALRQDPTAVAAVSTLGFEAQLRGDLAGAQRLFGYSQKLSRRDLPTQLWAVENAVARGDIAGALQHYDIALRTSKSAPDILFPVLAGAIADPAIRYHLIATLAKKPVWGPGFIAWLAGNGTDPQAAARLFLGIRQAGIPLTPEAVAAAVNGLVAAGTVDDAWRFYSLMYQGVDRRVSRDPRFTANLSTASLFDWQPVDDGTISTSIQRGTTGGVFVFSVPSSGGGMLLRQMQMLPAGNYQLSGHSEGINQRDSSLPYWALTCANGRELGRVVVTRSTVADGNFTGRFSVPSGCPVQTLSLVAKPSDDVEGVTGQIDRVRLAPKR